MLTIESLNATRDLVAVLADKGVTLRPVAGSPIAEAMSATKVWGTRLNSLEEIDTLPLSLYRTNETQVVNGTVVEDIHGSYQEAASQALGTALAAHVAHAVTVVLPAISELHNTIKAEQNLDDRCGVRSFKVEMTTGSPLLDVSEIVSEIDKFADVEQTREMPLILDYKPLGDEDLIKLLKIGAETYDNAIDAFVAQVGIETIREVWNVVFASERGGFKNYDEFRADGKKGVARNFATFLFAGKLLADEANAPEVTGLGGLSSSKYSMTLVRLRETAGAALSVQLMSQRRLEKSGRLIDKIDGKVVYVNKSVFDRYMADGGDIETILGAVVSGGKAFYVEEIAPNVDKFKQAWDYYVGQSKINAASSELIDVKVCIDSFVRNYMRTTDDEVLKQNRERIMDNLEKFLGSFYSPALKNVDLLAMNVMCQVVFNHTDAGEILAGVNEAMTINPEISKEDALNLAVTNYVANWFASQVEIDQ